MTVALGLKVLSGKQSQSHVPVQCMALHLVAIADCCQNLRFPNIIDNEFLLF